MDGSAENVVSGGLDILKATSDFLPPPGSDLLHTKLKMFIDMLAIICFLAPERLGSVSI